MSCCRWICAFYEAGRNGKQPPSVVSKERGKHCATETRTVVLFMVYLIRPLEFQVAQGIIGGYDDIRIKNWEGYERNGRGLISVTILIIA